MQTDHPFEGLSHNFIPPSGPSPCDILLVGESPGHEEDEAVPPIPFCGKTGRELDKFFLPLAMLRRPEVRITNLIPYHPYSNRNPTKDEVKFFEHYLYEEIAQTKPKIIVPMGAFAVKWFLGGHTDLHTVHGLGHRSDKAPDAVILPSYHPAAGLHNPENLQYIVYDFQQIHLAMLGKLQERPKDAFPNPIYIELFDADDVFAVLEGVDTQLMGMDTEGYKDNPWGLSFSIEPGTAYVIRFAAKSALLALDAWLQCHPNAIVILHNALHDLPILREMGVRVQNFEDTMVYSYELCFEPQGLKDLAYRLAGMRMKSYEEVTGPAMRKLTAEYLIKVASGDWGLDPPVPERESDFTIKYRQPQALHKRAQRAVNDLFGMYTGTIIGEKRGGSAKLSELGVHVGKVDHATVARLGLIKQINVGKKVIKTKNEQIFNAWFAEVPIPLMPKLDAHYGEFIFELNAPVPPEDPADSMDRWKAMATDLEESVTRCEESIGVLTEIGLDAIEDQQVAINYSARDADSTLRVRHTLRKRVDVANLTDLAMLDMSVMPYIDAMRSVGIRINRDHMLDYGAQLKIEMRELQEKLKRDLGIEFNPSSSPQVAMVIYDILGFPVEVRTEKGQPSTNDKVLEALAPLNPSITDITTFRELHKLRSTYALKLPRWMDKNGRLHPTWKATRVPSGRLACADPNLMAIPIRTERGNMIRRGFVPEPGMVFVGVDLSQIEMRVLAHISRDPNLIKLFTDGLDFHTSTAAFMWKCSEDEIWAEHLGMADFEKKFGRKYSGPPVDPSKAGGSSRRSSGKNVSFGIVYGVTATGLQAQVKSKTHQDWSEEECQHMIDMWLEDAYPGVRYYMDKMEFMCRQKGYVTTLMGRRRYLPGVFSSIHRIRSESRRQAINNPIQGTAAEVIKIAMQRLWHTVLPVLWEAGICVRPVLQIHDELIFECQKDAGQEIANSVVDAMENAMRLCVPVMAEYHITRSGEGGGSWADLK